MGNKFGLIFAIAVTVAGLSAVDLFLAQTEKRELRAAARRDFNQGVALVGEGRASDAVGVLRKAHAMDRDDPSFALELAAALMQAGKRDDAQSLLTSELEQAPNEGQANLLEARLMVREGRYAEALPYYHRAIYGTWPDQAGRRRVEARLELAELLASHGSSEELLAELLPLDSEPRTDLTARKEVARLYLAARSPERAAAAYRGLIREDPGDSGNYGGLGQAELASGDYRAAQAAFQKAGAKDGAALATALMELDPTPRYLGAAGKFSRSVRILQLARDSVARCSPELAKQADELLAKKIRGDATDELADERVSMAEQLWRTDQGKCGARPSAENEELRLLMTKLAGR